MATEHANPYLVHPTTPCPQDTLATSAEICKLRGRDSYNNHYERYVSLYGFEVGHGGHWLAKIKFMPPSVGFDYVYAGDIVKLEDAEQRKAAEDNNINLDDLKKLPSVQWPKPSKRTRRSKNGKKINP